MGIPIAYARSLSLSSLKVDGLLDADGLLHITERHEIKFDGDWNGGFRKFNLRSGQEISEFSMSRIEGTAEIELNSGDLSRVDQYKFVSGSEVRWRSRLSHSPPFDNKTLTYLLRYKISNVLYSKEGRIALGHEFGVPESDIEIYRFSAALQFAPQWRVEPITALSISRFLVRPKTKLIIKTFLSSPEYLKIHGMPPAFDDEESQQPPSLLNKYPIFFLGFILCLIIIFILFRSFIADQKARGRFDQIPQELVDEKWLNQFLFRYPPEVVAALWDETIGQNEVAVVLMRLLQRGDLQISELPGIPAITRHGAVVELRQNFQFTATCDAKKLAPIEASLLNSIFVKGLETPVTCSEIILTYADRSSRFSPESSITEPLEKMISRFPEFKDESDLGWIYGALVLVFSSAFLALADASHFVAIGGFELTGLIFALFFARVQSKAITNLDLKIKVLPFIAALPAMASLGAALYIEPPFAWLWQCIWVVQWIACAWLTFALARSRNTRSKMQARQRFELARRTFERFSEHLPASEKIVLYLIALNLGSLADSILRYIDEKTKGVRNADERERDRRWGNLYRNRWPSILTTFASLGALSTSLRSENREESGSSSSSASHGSGRASSGGGSVGGW